jgi:predicted HTH domain antitoxin
VAKKRKREGNKMGFQLHIPESVLQSIRLPEERIEQELLKELATSLYAHGLLSFGKGRELAGLGKYEFGRLLGERGILRHYGPEELEDDLKYARGE